MSITEDMRKAFDACTVMAGVEPDFECVYMTKGAALLYLDEIDAENERLREQIDAAHMSRLLTENENAKLRELSGFMLRCMKRNHDCDCCLVNGEHCEISYIESDARELGVEVD